MSQSDWIDQWVSEKYPVQLAQMSNKKFLTEYILSIKFAILHLSIENRAADIIMWVQLLYIWGNSYKFECHLDTN